jgi:hypothetical protein
MTVVPHALARCTSHFYEADELNLKATGWSLVYILPSDGSVLIVITGAPGVVGAGAGAGGRAVCRRGSA